MKLKAVQGLFPVRPLLAGCIILMALSAGKAHAFCFDSAAHDYSLDPKLLRAIATVESGINPAAVNRNWNGTYDFGIMQINSAWYPVLGHEGWLALGDPCHNVKVGAWILSECVKKHGNRWKAVACYNAGNAVHKGVAYVEKVKKEYFATK